MGSRATGETRVDDDVQVVHSIMDLKVSRAEKGVKQGDHVQSSVPNTNSKAKVKLKKREANVFQTFTISSLFLTYEMNTILMKREQCPSK